jgi:hypothetical protein
MIAPTMQARRSQSQLPGWLHPKSAPPSQSSVVLNVAAMPPGFLRIPVFCQGAVAAIEAF